MGSTTRRAILAAVAVSLVAGPALALINPDFTPVDMLGGARLILVLRLKPADKGGDVAVEVVRALVGKAPAKAPVIDITSGAKKAHLEMVGKIIAALGTDPAVLVAGTNEDGEDAAWLHVGGRWVDLYTEDDKVWEADQINSKMEGTWAGSSNMLIKCLQYVQKSAEPDVPVNTGCSWGERVELGKVAGKVSQAAAVDLAGDGKLSLYVASDAGDRLYHWDKSKEALADATAARKLSAKSKAAAWADFNADGRLDLASWDGEALSVYLQGADGAFPTAGRRAATAPKAGCLGLTALDAGAKAKAGILVSTPGAPVLLVPRDDGDFAAKALDRGKVDAAKLGKAGACLVGDIDGDGLPDVLQPFAKSSLFYKAKAAGVFAAAVACEVALGEGESGCCLGDYDADGMLDVFAAAGDRCRLWQNAGKMKFLETVGRSGEIAYISQPFGVGGQTCDVNNDGRQDILIVYSGRSPHIFFNRGFRSFGHSHMLDLEQKGLLADAADGLQAACVADLNGDGAQDMAVVLANGKAWMFPRDVVDLDGPPCVRVALPVGGPCPGPVTVTGWIKDRCLGAWNVRAGTAEAFFGHSQAGEIVLKWRLPGRAEQSKTVKPKSKPVRVLIAPK